MDVHFDVFVHLVCLVTKGVLLSYHIQLVLNEVLFQSNLFPDFLFSKGLINTLTIQHQNEWICKSSPRTNDFVICHIALQESSINLD